MRVNDFKSKLSVRIFVILIMLGSFAAGFYEIGASAFEDRRLENFRQTNTPRKIKRKRSGQSKMNQSKPTAVTKGVWAADGISLTVEESGVKIQYPCAEGEITQKLMMDKQGNFSANGVHRQQKPGPVREDSEPSPQPARFEGRISDKTMTLKVTLTESATLVGEFTLERGKAVRLHRCL